MQALILAAGFGTRLYPLTEEIPKALIKVRKRPIIEHTISKLQKIKELETIYILSNNKFYMQFLEWLDDFRNNNKNNNLKKIIILNNGVNKEKDAKGAIVDLQYALNIIKEDNLFVLASDNLFTFDLQNLINFAKEKNSSAVILKIINNLELVKKYSCVLLNEEEKITFYEEKPLLPRSNICSTACYLLKKQDLELVKNHNFTGTDAQGGVINFLYKKSRVHGKLFEDFWIDIGSFEELERARKTFKNI